MANDFRSCLIYNIVRSHVSAASEFRKPVPPARCEPSHLLLKVAWRVKPETFLNQSDSLLAAANQKEASQFSERRKVLTEKTDLDLQRKMRHQRTPASGCFGPAQRLNRTCRLGQLFLLAAVALGTAAATTTESAAACKRVLWFHAVGGGDTLYHRLLYPAIASAAVNAPALEPHLLFDPSHSSSPLPTTLQALYRAVGGTVHHHSLSFHEKLQEAVRLGQRTTGWLAKAGAFLRLDIADVFASIKPSLNQDVYETTWVLYTDIDVLFMGPISSCTFPTPRILAMGSQAYRNTIANSGIMVLNVEAFGKHKSKLLEHAVASAWNFTGFDQPLLLSYFAQTAIDMLPDAFNWKGYWGYPAPGEGPIRIAHWHGPKPGDGIHCLLCTTIRGCGMRVESCGVPPVYQRLFSMAPDLVLYRDMVLLHNHFTWRASELSGTAEAYAGTE